MAFQGLFDFTLDAKNRLTVPSKLRAPFSEGVVLAASLDPCIGVWRPAEYETWWKATLAGHSPLTARYRALERHFNANSFLMELDGAGRVMVPARLMDHAGLQREVSLIGAGEKLEIWDRERWSAYQDEVIGDPAAIAAELEG